MRGLDPGSHKEIGGITTVLCDNVGDVPLVFVQEHFGQGWDQLEVIAELLYAFIEEFLHRLQVQAAVLEILGVLLQQVHGWLDDVVKAF